MMNSSVVNLSSSEVQMMQDQLTSSLLMYLNNATKERDVELQVLKENIDAIFLLVNGIVVSLMQTGFACLEAGCVNSKNVTNIIMKNTLDMFICAICYWLVGYTLAYSPGNLFLGHSLWIGIGLAEKNLAHWFFQFVFAATAATIISGAVAERCNFVAYIAYSCVLSGFVYPIASHWVWGDNGMLKLLGYRDFAGGGVIHALAGACSFVAAIFIGPRTGRFENGLVVAKPGHSTPLTGIGGLLLITGFMSFIGGSQGHITQPEDGGVVARAVINTILGGSGAAVVILVLCGTGVVGNSNAFSFNLTLNATLAGIVSVCAGADVFHFGGAIASGAVACVIFLVLRQLVLLLRVDDPLDAVAVHFGGGVWGVISLSLWAKDGVIFGSDPLYVALLWQNIVGMLIIILWSVVCSIVLFGSLKLSGYLRVSIEDELRGLDISKHNEPAYPPKGWTQARSNSIQVGSAETRRLFNGIRPM